MNDSNMGIPGWQNTTNSVFRSDCVLEKELGEHNKVLVRKKFSRVQLLAHTVCGQVPQTESDPSLKCGSSQAMVSHPG
jgi:hypothetical protein